MRPHVDCTRHHKVVVVAQQKATVSFLKAFFRNRRVYQPLFTDDLDSFRNLLAKNPSAAVIAEESLLPAVFEMTTRNPVFCLCSDGFERAHRIVTRFHVRNYLCRPFNTRELEFRLESMIVEHHTFERMNAYISELEIIRDVSHLVSSTLDPKQILFLVVKKIAEIMPVTRCSIVRVDWLRKNAHVVASFEDPDLGVLKIDLKKYPEIAETLRSGKPVVVSDVNTDPLMARVRNIISPLGIRSIMVVPIFYQEKVIGTLFLRTSRSGRPFQKSEVGVLNAIAECTANALNNAFLFEQVEDEKSRLEKLAITDYLTGSYNLRYFSHRIIEEFSRSARYDFPISCMMIDIDYFKRVNDAHGHKTGDRVLKEFAQQIRLHSRKSDVVARYGGEEFIVMLPQTSLKGAISEAERFRKHIRKYRFKSLRQKGGVTVSIGLASYPHPQITSHDTLISCADDALYQAKTTGRDKVAVFA